MKIFHKLIFLELRQWLFYTTVILGFFGLALIRTDNCELGFYVVFFSYLSGMALVQNLHELWKTSEERGKDKNQDSK